VDFSFFQKNVTIVVRYFAWRFWRYHMSNQRHLLLEDLNYIEQALPSFNAYKTILSESRQGINMSEMELCNLYKIISPLVKRGQSILHIHRTNDIQCTRATLYNYLSKNCFSVGPINLPRKVRLKK